MLGDWTLAGPESRDWSVISSLPPLLCTGGSCEAAGLRLEVAEDELPWCPPETSLSSRELPDTPPRPELVPGRGLSAAGVSAKRADRVPPVAASPGEARAGWVPGDGCAGESDDLRRVEGEVWRLPVGGAE